MKCFYHNDMDGRCAGSIVAQYENNYNKENFFEVDYLIDLTPMLDKIEDGEKVYFVDYSFKEDTKWILDNLKSRNCDVIWIDHHTSSLNLCDIYKELNDINGIRQDGISGAGLTFMYFNHQTKYDDLPFYIKFVSDYDCWIYKHDPYTTHFKIGIECYNYNALDNVWKELSNDYWCEESCGESELLAEIIEKGKIIKSYIDRDNEQYRNQYAYETEIEGNKCLVVNRKTNSWIFGEKYNEYPLVMVWAFNGEKYSYSIFSSNKDIDCSKIAEKFGGGGHKGAAGFSSNEMLFKKIY